MNKLIPWLRLMRLSNLPTAWSNILMGYVLAVGYWDWRILLLLGISSCLYLAGMILNDVFDIEVDRRERPERVLPSGEIDPRKARLAALLLMAVATLIAALSALQGNGSGLLFIATPTFGTTLVLIIAIVVYNSGGKDLMLGPLLMGLCRTLNVLLGTSLCNRNPQFLGYDQTHWVIALCIGLFVAGITWFSRQEHKDSSRRFLITGSAVMLLACGAMIYLPFSDGLLQNDIEYMRQTSGSHKLVYCGMLIMVLFPAFRRGLLAILAPTPVHVQRAVVACLLTLTMIDAALCYLLVPEHPGYAMVVALLIIPAAVMGRYLRAT